MMRSEDTTYQKGQDLAIDEDPYERGYQVAETSDDVGDDIEAMEFR